LNLLPSMEKRLASRLVRHAAIVLPHSLARWGTAMQHEIEHIQPDRDALRWALGCVSTSYIQRLASLNVVQVLAFRWLLALFIASWAIGDFFAVRFLYLKTAGWLGLKIAGDSGNFIAALSALPSWLILLDGIGGLLYIVAAYWLTRRKAASLWVLAMGIAINCIGCVSQILLLLQRLGPASFLESARHVCFTYALQTCVILLLWHSFGAD